jgi:hypothetical protein
MRELPNILLTVLETQDSTGSSTGVVWQLPAVASSRARTGLTPPPDSYVRKSVSPWTLRV